MKVYCVCIEESDDEGDIFRVEIFSSQEKATAYLNNIVNQPDITADIVEYTIDEPESGDTTYAVDDTYESGESESDSDEQ